MLPIMPASKRAKRGEEQAVPRPRAEHLPSKGYPERAIAEKKMESREKAHGVGHQAKSKEPMKTAKAHEREGMKREMEHKKVAREHERKGEEKYVAHKKAVERKDHKLKEHAEMAHKAVKGRAREVHIHHWHHGEKK